MPVRLWGLSQPTFPQMPFLRCPAAGHRLAARRLLWFSPDMLLTAKRYYTFQAMVFNPEGMALL